jgi:hypothetical protein
MADPTNFLISTDYPMDKIVYKTSGSYTHDGSAHNEVIPHGLPFTPMVFLQWSLTSDFAVCYTDNTGPLPTDPTFYYVNTYCQTIANETNITISMYSYVGGITIYYRVFAFEPPTSTATCAPTSSTADNFILSTDYNHPKIYMSGEQAIDGTYNITIDHNLGYIPQFEYWIIGDESTTKATWEQYVDRTSTKTGVFATTTQIIGLTVGLALTNPKIGYIIYYDKA